MHRQIHRHCSQPKTEMNQPKMKRSNSKRIKSSVVLKETGSLLCKWQKQLYIFSVDYISVRKEWGGSDTDYLHKILTTVVFKVDMTLYTKTGKMFTSEIYPVCMQ